MQTTGEVRRCSWCGTDPLYVRYHDEEWGRFVDDDHTMFEFLILEGAQAGLSWLAILQRRENYRRAFAGFDAHAVAQFTDKDVERLLADDGIIRNRMKIVAAISNARCFLAVQEEFGSFCAYLTSFLPNGKPIVNHWRSPDEVPASTPLSETISKDMKKRGFKFFGPTICYAHLQAVGYINDHLLDCSFR
ncbi:MAG: DNA-3-methyladenine glycosylase I [Coriobacteriales bacterium]|jgi:DNA-3-methyladenine glycosylase I|nr:DNA-3-methyladenine glycosylase I [Coriobacteriales bacterium]